MLNFRNDYSAGAHPAVLEALCRTNLELTPGYGLDPYCEQAAETVRGLKSPKVKVAVELVLDSICQCRQRLQIHHRA